MPIKGISDARDPIESLPDYSEGDPQQFRAFVRRERRPRDPQALAERAKASSSRELGGDLGLLRMRAGRALTSASSGSVALGFHLIRRHARFDADCRLSTEGPLGRWTPCMGAWGLLLAPRRRAKPLLLDAPGPNRGLD